MTFKTRILSTSAAVLLAAVPASAQELSGTVTDSSSTARFQGAEVTILELGRTEATDRFGAYRFSGVAPGSYTLSTSYLGAEDTVQTVTVTEDGSVVDVVLGEGGTAMDNVIVTGVRAAQAGAINQQRASDSIISVIDSDGLGDFPDTTVADSLQRVAGLSIETDQGEGRYVTLRGINSDLISTSINGVRTPSPEDRRGVLLDGVPSDLLDGITVQKSLTPDVDADTLGGVINLKTISAFEREGRFARAKVEGRYNTISGTVTPKITTTYSDTFNDRLGMAVSLNYQNVDIESHNNEAGGFGTEGGDNFFLNDDFEQRWYDIERERYGFVGNLDVRASDSTDLYVRTLYNRYVDDEVRNKFELRDLDDGTALSETQSIIAIDEVDAEVRERREIREIQTYAVGGETLTGPWSFQYEAAYAMAMQDDSDNHDITFRAEDLQDLGIGDLILDTSDPREPLLIGDDAIAAITTPANFQFDELEQERSLNEDTEITLSFDAARDLVWGDNPLELKAGVKLRDREKTRDIGLTFFESDESISLLDFRGDRGFIEDWRLDNPMPAFPDAVATRAFRDNGTGNLELAEDDTNFGSIASDYRVDERVFAAYAMGTLEAGPATIVAGARLERTDLDLQGNRFAEEGDVDDVEVLALEQGYTDILPSLNVKYDVNDRVIARGAYYASLVRPSFGDVAPFVRLNDDRDEAEIGNPDLDPLKADNFDLSLEFYPDAISVFSVGAFYKSIDNAVFEAEFDIEDAPANLPLTTLFTPVQLGELREIVTSINVGSSEVYGVEFNMVQDFAAFSEQLEGVVLSANLTLADSSSDIPDGSAVREARFLKQSDVIGNVALAYDKGPYDLRISANYRGDYIDELVLDGSPGDPEFGALDRFADDRFLVEASVKYDVSDTLQVYVEGKNLTDAPEFYYFGDESRLSQYDEFGRTFIFGTRYSF